MLEDVCGGVAGVAVGEDVLGGGVVADGDTEPAVVGADDVQVEADAAGDVELGLLARIRRLVELGAAAGALGPRRLCNEEEMISWDSRNSRS